MNAIYPPFSDKIWLDVRSPEEYEKGHIPGAKNLPLFSNEERAEVGTVYVQQGREEAISLGLKLIAPKLSLFDSQVLELSGGKRTQPLMLYCARGGMRSASLSWLLQLYGYDVAVYSGGYRAFRQQLPSLLDKAERIVLLHGATGVGKTLLLQALAERQVQVIDLEGLARHKGSAFGYLPNTSQPSNEMMANFILLQLLQMDLSRPIFLESESKKVGSVDIPDALFERMKRADYITIEAPIEKRIERIVADYATLPSEMLVSAFEKISRRLGSVQTDAAICAVREKDYPKAISIALHYYDKAYQSSSGKLFSGKELARLYFDHEKNIFELLQQLERIVSSK
ncbi:hypothetical protein HQ45_02280 [Porphyromonas crevioricanis]|uniref:tRNA 2-selenouridine synthase n=1 Tax=Porphyromonas crevioricanis TaxID=393921 RepID=A0A0A2FLF1_9PORP|nr:tRNA 2-selenouridine(34) synthase MnmH [Porphyromonas crevioricanis]KGN90962.1 hypothetical protein HQ45_02280 [Porphyromonas crevioricanis]GAD06751.1 selenophosphate-dependent tRNA 2-selenouridine synthase [Porphyromonas crevioricanis JCM 13913]SQH73289.1 tRNA 2-selenouridine synthase [Porphyromonas crevioricanis]